MNRKHISWAAGAIVAAAIVAVAADQLYGMRGSQVVGDFRNAAAAEVVDAQGQPLLRGSFAPVDGDDEGEVERLAKLSPVTAGSTAAGEAEVEYQTEAPDTQEIELSATGISAGAQVSLVIDGTKVATATADAKGTVDVEIEARAGGVQ
jgi:hypothetical protein